MLQPLLTENQIARHKPDINDRRPLYFYKKFSIIQPQHPPICNNSAIR